MQNVFNEVKLVEATGKERENLTLFTGNAERRISYFLTIRNNDFHFINFSMPIFEEIMTVKRL